MDLVTRRCGYHQLSVVDSSPLSAEVAVPVTKLMLALGTLGATLACSNPFGGDDEVRLFVHELQAPAFVSAAGPLDATAVVSTGGCISFRRLELERAGSNVQITAVGHDGGGPGINCPANIRLEPKAFRINGPFSDSLVLSARQPNRTSLRHVVTIR